MSKTCEEIFYSEFVAMMHQRKADRGVCALYDIPVPKCWNDIVIPTLDSVMIRGISEPYFERLNDTEAFLWAKPNLVKRKFDSNGNFIMRKDDSSKYELEDVTLPHLCAAVLSDKKIEVPYSVTDRHGRKTLYKPAEGYAFVDVVNKKVNKTKTLMKYVYIIPKQNCFKENNVALILTFNKMRSYYAGYMASLTNGQYVYLYVVPYKPVTDRNKGYRVLKTKTTDVDFEDDISQLTDFWVKTGVMFNPTDCEMLEGVKGLSNLAYSALPPTLDEYTSYDEYRSMAEDTDASSELF